MLKNFAQTLKFIFWLVAFLFKYTPVNLQLLRHVSLQGARDRSSVTQPRDRIVIPNAVSTMSACCKKNQIIFDTQ